MKKLIYKWLMVMLPLLMMAGGTVAQTNQYLHHDGIDDHVALPNGSQYFTGGTGMTMTGWFYDDALGYGQGMMGFRGNQGFYMIQLNDGKIECRFINASNVLAEFVAPANTTIPKVWQHFAWIYDGSAVKLYVNGNLKGSKAASGSITDNAITFAVGRNILADFQFYYHGRIDEITVWNKALTQAEVQDLMLNELVGDEPGLQLYYKFNQGVPGGDNTSITKLTSMVDSPNRDADLLNYAMTGEESNFNGTVDPRYQAISFPAVPNKLYNAPAFELTATATSGLDVSYEIVSGPASVAGNVVTLTGDTGKVVVKAIQPGNADFDPAVPVYQNFMVLNPATHLPEIDARNPLAGNVYMPQLSEMELATIVSISYPELFSVSSVEFKVGGNTISTNNWYNDHYTALWLPPAYGSYDLEIVAKNNYGFSKTLVVPIQITSTVADIEAEAFSDIWVSPTNTSQTMEGELPSYVGAFNKITATLNVHCPPTGGCGEWDRVVRIEARDHEGRWFEIIRYITPYGKACVHDIDLTDYMSILQGKVSFRIGCNVLDNGYMYDLTFDYSTGTPAHKYSRVDKIWWEDYPFGDYANLQPVEDVAFEFPENTVASTLKIVTTGHGGPSNTGNAAEFYDATHHIWVNGTQTFTHHSWIDCNPNPDGCQPQNGTWYYNRAGFCPGAISPWFDYNMTPYIAQGDVTLDYRLQESYVDQCHPNYPDCVGGTTACPSCNGDTQPILYVACNIVNFADSPIVISTKNNKPCVKSYLNIYPNPTSGEFDVTLQNNNNLNNLSLDIYDNTGRIVKTSSFNDRSQHIDLKGQGKGVYFVKVYNSEWNEFKKLIVY